MANRACPVCGKIVPAGEVLAWSDLMECPHCHTALQATTGGRSVAVWLGLGAGWLAWWLTRDAGGPLGVVLPELYAILAFGIVSPLVLIFSAGLQIAPVAPVVDVIPSQPAHGGGHH